MATIRKFLDLSTAHLPPQIGRAGLHTAPGITAHETPHGWLMWVPDDPDDSSQSGEEAVPAEVLAVQRYARGLECDYVMFDRDAETDAALPTWDW